jgi:hypothetical protein
VNWQAIKIFHDADQSDFPRPPDGRESHSLDGFCVRPYLKLGPEFQELFADKPVSYYISIQFF